MLRIAVVGAGGIGSTFAFQLATAGGHDVTAVVRPGSARLDRLRRDGGIVTIAGERANVAVTDVLDETIAYDLVLVTVLAHQVDAVLPALQRSAAKHIQFMFNTFDPERLRDAAGAHRTSLGMPFVQGSFDANGKLDAKIHATRQSSKMDDRACVAIFTAAGLPAVFEPDMPLWLRCHVPSCIAFESISVAAKRRGNGASWSEAMTIARGLRECLTLVQRLGYRLYPPGKARLHASPTWLVAAMLWSISRITSFRELLATGAAECRALADVLAANAPRAEPPVSVPAILAMKPSP